MTKEMAQKLLSVIDDVLNIDAFAGCSDLYFRQMMTLRLKNIKFLTSYEALKAEANAEEPKLTEKKG